MVVNIRVATSSPSPTRVALASATAVSAVEPRVQANWPVAGSSPSWVQATSPAASSMPMVLPAYPTTTVSPILARTCGDPSAYWSSRGMSTVHRGAPSPVSTAITCTARPEAVVPLPADSTFMAT